MAKVNWKKVIEHEKLTQEELPDKVKKYIAQYELAISQMNVLRERLERKMRGYYNKSNGKPTEKYESEYNTLLERAEDYNERIIEELADYMESKTEQPIAQIEEAPIVEEQQPIKKSATFWWAR